MRSTSGPNRRIDEVLYDLLEQGNAAGRLIVRGKAAYDADEMLRLAAESLLLRCGEVVARLDAVDDGFVSVNPDLELRQLKNARNVVAHGYDIVDAELVWDILAVNLPRVMSKVRNYLG